MGEGELGPGDPRDVLRERFRNLAPLEPSPQQPQPATPYQPAPPATRLGARDLDYAFAANLFDLFRSMANLPGAELEETPALSRHRAFPFNPMFTGAWRTRVPDGADAVVEETLAWFASRDAPFAFWWVDPRTEPPDLGDRLLAHGLEPWELDAPGMAADLSSLDYAALARVPAGYDQVRARDDADLRDFAAAFVEGFGVPGWAGQAWVDATTAFGVDAAPWQCYVGRLDGVPVASTMLFVGAGVASVFGVATVPAARGRGLGAAITLRAFDDARRRGYRYGVLFGTELGAPVYRRIGFHDVAASMSRYLWRA